MNLGPTSEERAAIARLAIDNDNPNGTPRKAAQGSLATLDLRALSAVRAVPKAFAVEGVVPAGEVTLFTGAGASGKSLLAQQLATCAAAGIPCLGLGVQPTASLYVTCEDDAEQLHWRQQHICEALGVDMASLADRLHLVSRRGELDNVIGVRVEPAAHDIGERRVTTALYNDLARTMRATDAKLVFLDNVAHLFDGNENDRGDVTQFVNLLNRLAGETGAAIVLIGHPNKSGDSYSGSTAWLNAVRSQATLELVHDENGVVLDRDARVLSNPKLNYGKGGEAARFRWHEWAYVLDVDLPESFQEQLAETVKASADNAAFIRCLELRNRQQRPVSDSEYSRTFAPAVFAEMPEAKGIGKKRLAAAMDRLFRIGAIERGVVCNVGRKDREGLLIKCADLCADPALTPCADRAEPLAPSALTHTPISKDIEGGALSAPATLDESGPGHD
ncbi:AAA family ATPase [Sphingomicrobium sp. XHP0239]|uniref:AAA family ATPase n=1 Tax=Sphingomicrobium maritimum TaxID=3133972 RepID=UPI0031CC88C6